MLIDSTEEGSTSETSYRSSGPITAIESSGKIEGEVKIKIQKSHQRTRGAGIQLTDSTRGVPNPLVEERCIKKSQFGNPCEK